MTNRLLKIYMIFALLTFLIPCCAGAGARMLTSNSRGEPSEPDAEAVVAQPDRVSVYLTDSGEVVNMDFEEYIVGVLAGEMPSSYEIEALKAQAVAARSYLKTRMSADAESHHGASICTDPNHCEGWLSYQSACGKWGEAAAKDAWEKFETAVNETKGEYMVCGGETVRAFFHSTSHGKTEIPSDVWGGGEYSYLQSVDSPWDESSPNFSSTVTVPVYELCEKLGVSLAQTGATEHTVGGSVKTVEIGGAQFKGTEIRSIFGLNSACFELSLDGENAVFSVRGYGHGVGMSQYGANGMAKEGKDYTEILKHYYTGVEIVS